MLTDSVAWLGNAPVRLVLRIDLNKLLHLRVRGFGGDEEANQVVAEWITRAVRNWELLVGWAIVWLSAHILMIIIYGGVLGNTRAALAVILAAEVIPGASAALYAIKFGISVTELMRVAKAVGAAESQSITAPAWTKRRGVLMVVTTSADWDLILPVTVAVVAAILVH